MVKQFLSTNRLLFSVKKKKTSLRLWEVTVLISQKSLLRQVKKQKEENEVLFWNEVLFSELSNGGEEGWFTCLLAPSPHLQVLGLNQDRVPNCEPWKIYVNSSEWKKNF